ncbi:MAG: alpha/beta hydrolase fold domain-containing protein [Pseudomonadota bacterium]
MSLLRPVLNSYLRLREKPHLRRASDPIELRRSFEAKARLFFHPPWSMTLRWRRLATGDALWAQHRRTPHNLTILHFHGGGFVFGSPRTHGAMIATLAAQAGARAVLPRYPLAPEHPYPAAIDHALAVYHALRAEPGPVVIGGDSAGGALALSLLARVLADGAPLPAAVYAFSPLTDLTFGGASFDTNAAADVMLPAERASEMAQMYLAGTDPTDPFVSPRFADFTGAPPVWITAGSTEILRDDSRAVAARMRAQRVDVTYVEEHDLPHVWPIFHNTLPEARATLSTLARWLQDHTGTRAPTR